MPMNKGGLKQRRGATLVLVAVMLLVLGGMAAFAVDLTRVYSGVTELQTGADAAALAGALRLARTPGVSAAVGTVTFAASNRAFGSPVALNTSDVEGGFWDPAAGTFVAGAWTNANAVRVTAQRSSSLAFGGFVARPSVTPIRRAVAWVGNQASRDCIKPWGIPLTYVNTLLGQAITTQAGVEALRALTATTAGQYQMSVVAGPNISNPRGTPNAPATTFLALTGSNSSRKEYQNAIIDLNCEGTADYTVGGTDAQIQTQPGRGDGDIPRTTARAIELNLPGNQGNGGVATCATQVGNDASCINPLTGEVGVTVTVAAATSTGVNSANLDVLMGYRLMCVFRGGNGNQPGGSSNAESCPWLASAGQTANNFVQGTLVGFPVATQAATGPGNTLGNTIGTAQKFVLVK
jgi:Flp pilus assembly protein TadG